MFELIAGPCSAESSEQVLSTAKEIASIKGVNWFRAGLWKPRTLPNNFEGVGKDGLEWLIQVRKQTGLNVITECARANHVEHCLKAGIDAIWIGARTTTNPFSVWEIAESLRGTDIPIFIKNPLNPDIKLWIGALERILSITKSSNIYAIHRGFSFADNGIYRQRPYWKMPIELKRLMPEIPIICDPSHISGKKELIEEISQTALNIGLDGLMIETHNNPNQAFTDKQQQITPKELETLLRKLTTPQKKPLNQDYHSNYQKELTSIREEIDLLDNELIYILRKRLEFSREVARLKKQENTQILQVERFQKMLEDRLSLARQEGISEKFIQDLFESIHEESIKVQNQVLSK